MIVEPWKSKWALAISIVAATHVAAAPLVPAGAGGGRLSTPAVHGDFAYVATGVTITTWDLSHPARPRMTEHGADFQAPGPICGLAVVGEFLYACWSNGYDAGGLAILSIADAAHPVYGGAFDDAIATAIASSTTHVYLAGSGTGVVALDVHDPLLPVVAGSGDGLPPASLHDFRFESDKLLLSGMNLFETGMRFVYELSDPARPRVVDGRAADFGFPPAALHDDWLIQAGQALEVFALGRTGDPAVFSAPTGFATTHARVKNDVLTLLGSEGAQTWDLSRPTQPALLRTIAAPSADIAEAIPTPRGFLELTISGEGIVIDDSTPSLPVFASTFVLPLGASTTTGAIDDRYGYLAEEAYGLRIVDLRTFGDVARIRVGEPGQNGLYGASDVIFRGELAFVLSPAHALVVFNVADRAHPVEVGRLSIQGFMTRMAIDHDRAYLATVNQPAGLIVDISDVANMRAIGTLDEVTMYDIAARDDHVFIAGSDFEPAGLRIVDASDAQAPRIVGLFTGCDVGFGKALDVSADGGTTYLGCTDGTFRILDTHDVTAPVQIGQYRLPDEFNSVVSLRIRGDIAYIGHEYGIDEVDIRDAQALVPLARHPTGAPVDSLAVSPNGSLLAFAASAGLYSFVDPEAPPTRGHGRHARPSALDRNDAGRR